MNNRERGTKYEVNSTQLTIRYRNSSHSMTSPDLRLYGAADKQCRDGARVKLPLVDRIIRTETRV
jgi:hypothetical protein